MTNSAIIAAENRSRLASSPRRRRYPPPESPPPPMVPPRPVDLGVWRRMPRIARIPITTWATARAVFTQQRLLDNASARVYVHWRDPFLARTRAFVPDIRFPVVLCTRNVCGAYGVRISLAMRACGLG